MITPTYENKQVVQLLAPLIATWLADMAPNRRRLFNMATSGKYRTYTAMAKDMKLSVTRVTRLMNRLRRGGSVLLRNGLKDAGLPEVDYDITRCPWGTLVALQTILDAGGAIGIHHQTQQDAL